jgi:hypothetical protein
MLRSRGSSRCLGIAAALVTMGVASGCAAGHAHVPSPVPPSPASSQALANAKQLELILAGIAGDAANDKFNLALTSRAQSLISVCMASHDLTYVPRDPRTIVDTVTDSDFASMPYAEKYGFGVTTFPTFAKTTDPNEVYVKALSHSDASRYQAALDSCDTSATAQANKEFGVQWANYVFSQRDAIVRESKSYDAAQAQWRTCAAGAGYPTAASRVDLIQELQAERKALLNDLTSRAEQLNVQATQDELAHLAATDPAWESLHDEEIREAVSTFSCSQALQVTYDRLYERVAQGQPLT